jgi:hypothetical protein
MNSQRRPERCGLANCNCARVREGHRRGTAVADAIKKLGAIAKVLYGLSNISPVEKDLKRP